MLCPLKSVLGYSLQCRSVVERAVGGNGWYRRPGGMRMNAIAQDPFVSLLRLRASPPAVPAGFVRRPRVEHQLTDAAEHAVTLVSAGPGYGKTLAMASWARLGRAPGVLAWLTMDETDNDLQGFWSDVLGALWIADALPPGR